MLHILQTALELGFLYALVPMALFLSFRILDIADMTTDGCFVLGTAVSVTMAAAGHPFIAVPAAMQASAPDLSPHFSRPVSACRPFSPVSSPIWDSTPSI